MIFYHHHIGKIKWIRLTILHIISSIYFRLEENVLGILKMFCFKFLPEDFFKTFFEMITAIFNRLANNDSVNRRYEYRVMCQKYGPHPCNYTRRLHTFVKKLYSILSFYTINIIYKFKGTSIRELPRNLDRIKRQLWLIFAEKYPLFCP